MTRATVFVALAAVLTLAGCRGGAKAERKLALLMGGSGETEAENPFVQDLRDFNDRLVARGWNTRVVAGLRAGLIGGSQSATNAHILAAAREVLGGVSRGDEALIVVHDHGMEGEPHWGQLSHSVATEDLDTSNTGPGFDLDLLEPELRAARKRGARVALVDLSCYSGVSQALRGANCVITLAAPHYVSLCSGREEERGFTSAFFRLPPPGTAVDLEQSFLSARRADNDAINLPQISSRLTPAVAEWDGLLAALDPLDVNEDLLNLKASPNAGRFKASRLLAALDAWMKRFPPSNDGARLRAEIGSALKRVVELRRALDAETPSLARAYDDARLRIELPDRPAFSLSVGNLAEFLDRLDARGGIRGSTDGYSQAELDLMQRLRPVREGLEARYHADLSTFRARRDAFNRESEEFETAADDLFNLERRFYDAFPEPAAEGVTRECSSFGL